MAEQQKNFKHIIRVMNTDLAGEKAIVDALRKIKGISFALSAGLCKLLNINAETKAGDLSDVNVEKLNNALKDLSEIGVPEWLFNRRKDFETGEDKHLIGANLSFQKDNDLKFLQKIKCYRGSRHSARLPSRGQKTKSNFRRNKGKVTGVKKKSK
jgi:small subunit ribosomal protein S13